MKTIIPAVISAVILCQNANLSKLTWQSNLVNGIVFNAQKHYRKTIIFVLVYLFLFNSAIIHSSANFLNIVHLLPIQEEAGQIRITKDFRRNLFYLISSERHVEGIWGHIKAYNSCYSFPFKPRDEQRKIFQTATLL